MQFETGEYCYQVFRSPVLTIPSEVVKNSLNRTCILILQLIAEMSIKITEDGTIVVRPVMFSQEWLAKRINMSREWTTKCLSRLKKLGYIHIYKRRDEKGRHTTNVYLLSEKVVNDFFLRYVRARNEIRVNHAFDRIIPGEVILTVPYGINKKPSDEKAKGRKYFSPLKLKVKEGKVDFFDIIELMANLLQVSSHVVSKLVHLEVDSSEFSSFEEDDLFEYDDLDPETFLEKKLSDNPELFREIYSEEEIVYCEEDDEDLCYEGFSTGLNQIQAKSEEKSIYDNDDYPFEDEEEDNFLYPPQTAIALSKNKTQTESWKQSVYNDDDYPFDDEEDDDFPCLPQMITHSGNKNDFSISNSPPDSICDEKKTKNSETTVNPENQQKKTVIFSEQKPHEVKEEKKENKTLTSSESKPHFSSRNKEKNFANKWFEEELQKRKEIIDEYLSYFESKAGRFEKILAYDYGWPKSLIGRILYELDQVDEMGLPF